MAVDPDGVRDRHHVLRQDALVTPTGSGSVLLVEDDATVAEVLIAYLERDGYRVRWEDDGARGLAAALADEPDLVVLDLMLPSLDGLEVCRRLRASAPVPVIMLTARGEEEDRIVGLELGADDYLGKPVSPRELVARVKAVLRRSQEPRAPRPSATTLEAGDLEVDVAARIATIAGRTVELTVREFELLVFLMERPGVAYRRDELLEHVWGYTYGDASTVTVHVRRLREKIEADPSSPTRLATVWGVGYRWDG
jgi:DNA-binding response OmpR family regulator